MNRWLAVAMPDERIFGLYLFSALVIAFLSWLYYRKLEHGKRPEKMDKGFLAYVLDRDVFLHRSALQDYIYFFVNAVIYVGIISQLLISTHFFMLGAHGGLQNLFGVREAGVVAPSAWTLILYTILYVLLLDFAIFITHLAQHKIPILWEFHKVHHSAEVLTPITLYRMHPVDLFFSGIVASALAGFGFAGFYYLTGETPTAFEFMGLNIILFLFYLLGYNLRHSHIWLSYPAWLSHILISPAQHQIHHSTEYRHFDKNLGLIFAFWDRLFGTLYVPQSYEKISYGINKKKPNPFRNVLDMYVQPFVGAWKLIYPDSKSGQRALIFVLAVIFFMANYVIFYSLDRTIQAQHRPLPSVHIEDLTWAEVRRSLDNGTVDTIIIATGGTEQGGPHLVLGKHNYIVRHNAEEIAKRFGGTLVAPVIAFVPEDIHMQWAGTISVPEEVLEGLLRATAENYITHGFKNILFIGDSHANQAPQEKVAAALTEAHGANGVKVVHVGEYYTGHKQKEWLLERGFTEEQIGTHAGIRDTSEILFIRPDALRREPWLVNGYHPGHTGDPTLASRKLGKELTELKVNAALNQIRGVITREGKKTTPDQAIQKIKYLEP